MEKEFIPYEQAVALKELGFDDVQSCISYANNQNSFGIASPTFSQAFRFFREKYNYWNYIFPNIHQKDWNYHIQYYDVNEIWGETYIKGNFKTYEEAELECLKKLIEIAQKE